MKKLPVRLLSVAILSFLFFLQPGCSKPDAKPPGNVSNFPAAASQPPPQKIQTGGVSPEATAACGGFLSGRYTGTGFYTYPIDNINVTCLAANTNFSVTCTALEVPNRFSVYDGAGNLVATTNWIGYANYSGPWGSSLNGPSSRILTIPKTGTGNYTLRVETVAGSISDAWEASIGCTCPVQCTNCPGCYCSTFFSGTHPAGLGFFIYPQRTIELSCLAAGKQVSVFCTAKEVPNRFSIYDGNTLVATTNWIGYANYPGPWGSSLNGPSSSTINFTKGSSANYSLRVETVTGPLSDSWEASVSCSP